MVWIAYFEGVYGPFNNDAEAELYALAGGWFSYDICDSEEEAWKIVQSEA